MEVFNPNSNIDFLRLRKISITISVLLVVISLVAIFGRGLNYGLDFTGGVSIDVKYDQPVDIGHGAQLRLHAHIVRHVVTPVGIG